MAGVILVLFLLGVLLPIGAVAADNTVTVDYFYISACKSCHDTEDYLADVMERNAPLLRERGESLVIRRHNTYEADALALYQKGCAAVRLTEAERLLPLVFVEDQVISGETAIKSGFETAILQAVPGSGHAFEETGISKLVSGIGDYRLLGVVVVGFVNGLTPCSISMLLFFVSLLMSRESHVGRMGLAYCFGKFFTYFALGTLFYRSLSLLDAEWVRVGSRVAILVMVLVFVVLNAMDFLQARREAYGHIKLQLPTGMRRWNHRWITAVAGRNGPVLVWMSLLLGAVTSLGEFLCTGQIYLTTLLVALHDTQVQNMRSLLFFFFYNLAFILPLLIITWAVHRGRSWFSLSERFRAWMPWIKLANIVVFAALGVVGWLLA